ncbi:AraC family transcriptional regulator [uncultured Paracoccus sp.]|uniref:helix-turn-helix transcriptional regulator n=1 Tax=uncultured Paracoccus sp. TaxID=189685 RepID=UPI00262146D9|nr:AraC family transcriptional regulator [uncultured Paracoccus sp.]
MTRPDPAKPGRNRRDQQQAPVRSYALDRADSPRFHIRVVEETQRLYPAHKHDYFQIVYFMTEAPALRIGLASHHPKPGSIYFIAPMVPHQIRFDQATRCVVIYFDLDLLRPGITRSTPMAELIHRAPELTPFACQNHVDFDLPPELAEAVERANEAMLAQHDSPRICAGEIIRAELLLMLGTLCQHYEEEFSSLSTQLPVIGRDSLHMRRISEFIGSNYTRAPSLDEASEAVNLSKSRFCGLIRQYTGTTFNALIREMRMEEARERLVLTDESIGQVAYAVGYQDEKYFLRAFKTATGMTPTAYRRKRAEEKADLDRVRAAQ